MNLCVIMHSSVVLESLGCSKRNSIHALRYVMSSVLVLQSESVQASMVVLETIAKGHSLIITDASAMVEVVAH